MDGSKHDRVEAQRKFDEHYRRATLPYVAQSLQTAEFSRRKNGGDDVARVSYCSQSDPQPNYSVASSTLGGRDMCYHSSAGDFKSYGGTHETIAIDTTQWVPTVLDGSVSKFTNTYWYDWYDWWRWPREHVYIWPNNWSDYEIRRLLEEIRDEMKKDVPNKLSKDLVSSNWPPSNVGVGPNGELTIDVALAGYKKSDIDVYMGADDKLIVEVPARDVARATSLMQNGIKTGKGKVEFFVDPDKFDATKIDVSFEDCILSITVERAEGAKQRKLTIR